MAINPVDVFGASERGLAARDLNNLRLQQAEQQQNALAAAERQRRTQRMRNQMILGSIGPTGQLDSSKLSRNLADIGLGEESIAAMDADQKRRAAEADIASKTATTGKATQETSDAEYAAKVKSLNDSLEFVAGATTPEGYAASRQMALSRGVTEEQLQSFGITPEFNPGAVQNIRQTLQSESDRLKTEQELLQNNIATGNLAVDRGNLAVNEGELKLNRDKFNADRADAQAKTDAALAAARDTSGLTPEQKLERTAKFPKAQLAYKSSTEDIDALIKDLTRLKTHEGLASITGGIEGRTPSVRAKATAAQALYDKILAKGQFRALQQMREASPTGGALGNVSDTEGEMLRASFGALNQAQSDVSLRDAITDVIADLERSRNNITEAYDLDYPGARPASSPKATPKGAAPSRATSKGTSYSVLED